MRERTLANEIVHIVVNSATYLSDIVDWISIIALFLWVSWRHLNLFIIHPVSCRHVIGSLSFEFLGQTLGYK